VQLGNEWKPPNSKEDSDRLWDPASRDGLVRTLLQKSLLSERDRLEAVAELMHAWEGDGATDIRLPWTDLRNYVRRLLQEKGYLAGPPPACTKSKPIQRYIFATIPAAHLLKERLPAIRVLLRDAFHFDRPPPLTKAELVQQTQQEQEQFEDQIATLQAKLNLAQEAKRQAAFRAGSARTDWQQRCRERLHDMRERAAEEARIAAEAAVQEDMDRINGLRNKANARSRGAEAREAASAELAAKRHKATQEAESKRAAAVSANEELHEQLEGSTHQDGVDALAKLAQIPKLGTVAVRRKGSGGAHAWDNGMRGLIVE
jgi:hypothetical protein